MLMKMVMYIMYIMYDSDNKNDGSSSNNDSSDDTNLLFDLFLTIPRVRNSHINATTSSNHNLLSLSLLISIHQSATV